MNTDFNNSIPIYIQILDNLKISIISGELKCGEKLPSVREYASMFKVNPNTMQKALMELEDLKLINTQRTNGKYVTTDENIIKKLKEEYALSISREYLNNMAKIGVTNNDVFEYLKGKDMK